ncbi:MAG: HEPN domain-containing protein [Pseudobutyrivibrio sp.]|nr:HEPN domain-containing protein [Pseudobutyrivibrio sp.]
MTKEQKLYKGLIKADLRIVEEHYNDSDKALRLQAAYHMQQAVEKMIKLKAELQGVSLWGHDIDRLICKCDEANIDIGIPNYIRKKAIDITQWEAECRYYPVKVVRKDTIKKIYDCVSEWMDNE